MPRALVLLLLTLVLTTCRGYDTIPAEEALWQRVQPVLVGMPIEAVERCAGPPLGQSPAASGATAFVYRAQDRKNYCEVSLFVRQGRVEALNADYAAPEFLWLRSGINYCGRIFAQCVR